MLLHKFLELKTTAVTFAAQDILMAGQICTKNQFPGRLCRKLIGTCSNIHVVDMFMRI